ncbi:MAG: prolipoprotein diacylglyceryl transferase [Alphaproteobacteria bacterium]|nr:prolipoprotein diacylglyceryl transferase [Alphaproteobacteria bacterium]MCB9791578.1 prolipoprotein diacylglyceryl transferase [Alphaproteobacteria bacterium]
MHPLIGPFDPPKLQLTDSLTIYSFGVLVALGFWFGNIVANKKAERDGLDPDVINRLVGWIVFGTFVGGHLGHALMYEPEKYLSNPIELLKVWQGLSSFGGFIGCSVITYWFFRWKERVPIMPYGDLVLYGLTLGWAFGRLGCFSVHDHPGTETDFWLGVYGTCPPDNLASVACHSLGLYEALHAFALFGLLRLLDNKPRFPGFFIGVVCLAYGPFRLFLDSFRHVATDTRYFGFTPAQYLSTLLTVIGIAVLVTNRNKKPVRPIASVGKKA